MAEDRVTRILERWRKKRGEKELWHSLYDDLARVQLPRRLGFATTVIEGERRTDDIFDGTPMQAARGLANAIGGLLRPNGIPEIDMKPDDDALDALDEVQEWIGDSVERMENAFNNPRAHFRQASGEKDQDLVVFGTAAMFVGEGLRRNHLLFQTLHLKDVTPVFNEDGSPEGIFRKRKMSIRHMEQRFGRNNLHEKTREKLDKTPDDMIDVLHVILPRNEGRSNAIFARNLPFADMWLEIESKHILSEGGFHEFPFIFPRWDTSSGEEMGRSPGMIALPDSDTLQAMGETILIAGQRAADPPLAAPNDGSFDALNTFPGGLSYYDIETAVAVRGNPFFPIESGTNLPISRDMQRDSRDQVFAAFFRNVLNLPVDGPEMTATEVIQRKEEFMREIGPAFGRLESDDTAPTVERAFMLMLRGGGFLPIPEVLQGQSIRFIYDSPVKRIRQQIEAASARLWAQEIIAIAEFKPQALDLINEDGLARFSHEALGLPNSVINGREVVDQIREARAAQQQALQQQEMMRAAVDTAEVAATAYNKATLADKPTPGSAS